jgi:hypothetical protein
MSPERITRERVVQERPHRTEVRERLIRGKPLTKRQVALYKSTSVIWWLTGILQGFFGFRLVLRMLAANPGNPFAAFVYALTDIFLWPFQTLVANPAAEGSVLEVSTVIAMMVYLLLAWVVVELLWLLMGRAKA